MTDIITEQIIGAAIEVHRTLGPGLLESIYETALCHELALQAIRYETQKPVEVIYKKLIIRGQRLDILVEEEVIVELKATTKITDVYIAQTLSYLKATGLKKALLLNFGEQRLVNGIKRISL
jgi:GxxExxY protein